MSDLEPFAPILVQHDAGARFRIRVREHDLIVDQPPGYGDDTGASPTELLGAALGACAAYYLQRFCQSRGLDGHGITVEVVQTPVRDPFRIGHFRVRVHAPATIAHVHAKLLERVVRTCPVHHTLAAGAAIEIEIEAAASAAATHPRSATAPAVPEPITGVTAC
jgi:putative redox protein